MKGKGGADMQKIGFIGLGVMGRSMALHLHSWVSSMGGSLKVWARRAETLAGVPLEEVASSPAELARQCDAIITMVGFPKDVSDLYLGSEGLIANAQQGALLVDMTTSSPLLAQELAKEGAKRGIDVIDAPVSGGDGGARAATLSIMCGATKAAFERAKPLLERMGTPRLIGGPGSGQNCKMVNQILVAASMFGVCEALLFAKKANLDLDATWQAVSKGAAASWSLDVRWPQILTGDMEPGFFVKHFIKDMAIAIESAKAMHLDLPGLELAYKLYRRLADQGGEDLGTQALYKLYEAGDVK